MPFVTLVILDPGIKFTLEEKITEMRGLIDKHRNGQAGVIWVFLLVKRTAQKLIFTQLKSSVFPSFFQQSTQQARGKKNSTSK